MRNGDFLPTRLQAQQDAVGIITQSKLRSNPESNVGLLTLSGLVEGEYNILFSVHFLNPYLLTDIPLKFIEIEISK